MLTSGLKHIRNISSIKILPTGIFPFIFILSFIATAVHAHEKPSNETMLAILTEIENKISVIESNKSNKPPTQHQQRTLENLFLEHRIISEDLGLLGPASEDKSWMLPLLSQSSKPHVHRARWRAKARIQVNRELPDRQEILDRINAPRNQIIEEQEPNNSFATSQQITGLALPSGAVKTAFIAGAIEIAEPTVDPIDLVETIDNGSINSATEVNFINQTNIDIQGVIGDGDFADLQGGRGDTDFYALRNLKANDILFIGTQSTTGFFHRSFDMVVYNSRGESIFTTSALNAVSPFDDPTQVRIPEDGDYFVAFGVGQAVNPFDPSQGVTSGPSDSILPRLLNNKYTLRFGVNLPEIQDIYRFFGQKGQVVGIGLSTNASRDIRARDTTILSLYDRKGRLLMRSDSSISAVLVSPDSNAPRGSRASLQRVLEESGEYFLTISGRTTSTEYIVTIRSSEPTLRNDVPYATQKIFVDFDGAVLDITNFPIDEPRQTSTLSPLTSFLSAFDLQPSDEDKVIDAVMKHLKAILVDDVAKRSRNGLPIRSIQSQFLRVPGRFNIELLNSRDDPDPGENAQNISRVIIGGTADELGAPVVGLSQHIDVGNFTTNDSAVVLLDSLSGSRNEARNINFLPRAPSFSKIDMIGLVVGTIAAHEIGHILGCFHTDNTTDPLNDNGGFELTEANIMDQGGNAFADSLGAGNDGIFGTEDDIEVVFGVDQYHPNELFEGFEDTLNTIGFGASTSKHLF